MKLRGQPVVEGLARGPAWRPRERLPAAAEPQRPVPVELVRFQTALGAARAEVEAERQQAPEGLRAFLEVQALLLEDPGLLGPSFTRIAQGRSAARALEDTLAQLSGTWRASPGIWAERCADLDALRDRLLRHLDGELRLEAPGTGCVLVARELAADDLLRWGPSLVGICLERGSPWSHAAYAAAQLRLPMICGLGELPEVVEGQLLAMDGGLGELDLWDQPPGAAAGAEPSPELLELPWRVGLMAPIELLPEEARQHGVGLLRTEGLLSSAGEPPSARAQEQIYRAIVAQLGGKPLVVRLFDRSTQDSDRSLGLRGIRWAEARPADHDDQLDAICCAAALGPLDVLLPFVSHPDEVLAARRHLEAAAARAGGPCPRLGVQIETPAAMLLADELLSLSDFALIGISDLLQLLVGADREDPRLLPWMEADHPALLRALASLGEAGCRSGRELWLAVGRQQLRRLGPHLGGLGLSGLVLPPRPRLP